MATTCDSSGKGEEHGELVNSLPPRIVCAAMLMKDDTIITGIRHFSPDMRSVMQKIYGDKYHLQVQEQGFVDQFGTFYNRKDAWHIADKNGQILRPIGWEINPTPRPP